MRSLLQDIRFGLRMLARNPGFTVIVVVTLALGIAANTTIFSWISSTLLDPIPGVSRTSDLVTVMRGDRTEHPSPPFSYLDYVDLRDANGSLSGLLAYHHDYMSLTGAGKPERVYGTLTSANYFDVLGVRPILGRGFLPAEEKPGGGPVVVISYGLWQSHFGADPSVIARTIQINRHPYMIVGVAPQGFQGCATGLRSDVWIPLGMDRFVWGWNRPADRGTAWLNTLGRIRPWLDRRQAEADLNLVMQRIAEQYPGTHQGPNQITVDPLWRSPFGANVYLYKTLPLLLALAVVLLLLACANVANLLLVRSVARRREIAIRLSIGASRWRVVRQLLVENVLLALCAGGVAVLLTTFTASSFAAFIPPSTLPITLNGRTDWSVLLAALFASVLTAIISGLLPALRSSGLAPVAVLKEEAGSVSGGLRKSRLSGGFVTAQIALSLLLLICAGLFNRSLQNAQRSDPGFDPKHVLLASYDLAPSGYSRVDGIEFDRKLLAKLEALPGVESATLADFSPLNFTIHTTTFDLEGYIPQPHESMEIDRANVGPNFFRTMRTALISGRDFSDRDVAQSQPVAIVNQALVERYWPGQDAIGKRIRAGARWFTVVGVARNSKYRRLIYGPEPAVFLPLYQNYYSDVTIHARVAGNPQAFASAAKRAVQELNPDLPVFNMTTLEQSMQFGSIFERIAGTLAGSFGLLALALAAIGIYGVVSYTTRQRTHEIGIRMALGAERADILRLVLGQGLRLTLAGLAIGLAVSFAFTPLLRSFLFGVGPADALTYAVVALLLGVVSLAACHIPARRATQIEPMTALRHE